MVSASFIISTTCPPFKTPTAKRIAEQRHEVMVQFLHHFMDEWEGKDVE